MEERGFSASLGKRQGRVERGETKVRGAFSGVKRFRSSLHARAPCAGVLAGSVQQPEAPAPLCGLHQHEYKRYLLFMILFWLRPCAESQLAQAAPVLIKKPLAQPPRSLRRSNSLQDMGPARSLKRSNSLQNMAPVRSLPRSKSLERMGSISPSPSMTKLNTR